MLAGLKRKYGMQDSQPNEGIIMPVGSYMVFNGDLFVFLSDNWIDPIDLTYNNRGNFPNLKLKTPEGSYTMVFEDNRFKVSIKKSMEAMTNEGVFTIKKEILAVLNRQEFSDEIKEETPKTQTEDEELYLRARTYREKGEYQKALPLFEQLIKNNPNSEVAAKAQYYTGVIYDVDLKDKKKARQEYEKVIAQYPNYMIVNDAKRMLRLMDEAKK